MDALLLAFKITLEKVMGNEYKKSTDMRLIVVLLSPCTFNSVAAAPVSKLTPDAHSIYAASAKGLQQTYITAFVCSSTTMHPATEFTLGVGQSVSVFGVLSSDSPATAPSDSSHGISNATVNIQTMIDDKTWNTVATKITQWKDPNQLLSPGAFMMTLTPNVAGVYTYWVTYDGADQYAPAVSNVVTLNCN